MLSTSKINIRKKTTEVLLNRQSKRTRNVIKSISDREKWEGDDYGEGGGGGGYA